MNEKEYIILRKLDPVLGGLYKKEPDGDAQAMNYRIDTEFLEKKHIADLQNDPKVIGLAPPMPMKLVKPVSIDWEEINHPRITWGVSVTRANDSPFTGSGVTVAVLDTGIDASHEAFRGIKLIQKDFTGEGNGDAIGHGTHCAGTIFGQTTADKRFGIAQGIKKVLIGKVLGLGGRGDTKQVVEAITWAIEKGAHIISMSLGFDFPGLVSWWVDNHVPVDLATSRALEIYLANIRLFEGLASLIRARGALFQGTLLLAAAGNESKRNINPDYELRVSPPASANGIISVGALKTAGEPYKDLSVADFSNIGPDIAAPGVGIFSAKAGGGYVIKSGTSMATPHAAGIAALWAQKLLEESGRLNISELTARLIGQASKDQLAAGFDPMDVGAGLVLAPLER